MAKTKVFDEYALLTFLEAGPGAKHIHDLILKAEQKQVRILMSSYTLANTWKVIAQAKSPDKAKRLIKEIRNMPIELVDVDWDLARTAAEIALPGNHSLDSYLAPALAISTRADLVTSNKGLDSMSTQLKIEWIPNE